MTPAYGRAGRNARGNRRTPGQLPANAGVSRTDDRFWSSVSRLQAGREDWPSLPALLLVVESLWSHSGGTGGFACQPAQAGPKPDCKRGFERPRRLNDGQWPRALEQPYRRAASRLTLRRSWARVRAP